jgi:hypothetical protein
MPHLLLAFAWPETLGKIIPSGNEFPKVRFTVRQFGALTPGVISRILRLAYVANPFLRTVNEDMSLKSVLLRALALALMLGAAACQTAPATSADKETERYAVYSAVIAELGDLPVLSDRVGGLSWEDSDYAGVHEGIEQVDPLIWDNLRTANDHTEVLQQRFDPALGEVSLANSADLGILFSKNKPAAAWEIFHHKYPGKCLLNVSNVGFSDALDKAILYTSHVCDEKSGGGKIIYLVRERGKWAVKDKVALWGQ